MSASDGPILVPLDGTPPPERALPESVSLARRLGCDLRLVYVIDPNDDQGGDRAIDASAYLGKVAERARARGVSCDAAVAVGDPADTVLHEADCCAARYVSLARGDRIGRDVSTVDGAFYRLLRHARVPVLVSGSACRFRRNRSVDVYGPIVVPLDGSEGAQRALVEAASLARTLGVAAMLVTAILPQGTLSDFVPIDLASPVSEREAANLYLRMIGHWMKADGVPVWSAVGHGPPGYVIAETAARQGASLIVMTTHARSGVGRLLLGNVANNVVRQTRIPVLLLGPETRTEGRKSHRPASRAA